MDSSPNTKEKHTYEKKQIYTGLIALLPLLGVAAESVPQPDPVLIYKTTPQGELKLHIFNPPGRKVGETAPAIVFFHGGG